MLFRKSRKGRKGRARRGKSNSDTAFPKYLTKSEFRKRKNRDKILTRIVRDPVNLIPDRLICPMKWNDVYRFTWTSTPPSFQQYVFRLNSVRDPDYTTGITQKSAYGYNSMLTMYANWRVYASKIVVKLDNMVTTDPVLFAVYPGATLINTTSDPNAKSASEKVYAKYKVSSPIGSGHSQQTLSNYISLKKLVGDPETNTNVEFVGQPATEPLQPFFWNFMADNCGNATAGDIVVDVEITYYTEWFNRLQLVP